MLLEKIKGPKDLKKLEVRELKELAGELRETIIERVALNGGHLASNLGVIDLTIALHYVFNSPEDKIIWDVGHQSYAHKLLTGRVDAFSTLRQYRGMSGFPKMDESAHDAFGTGHSSTSISAALGILEARDQKKEKFKVIAVIGDGAMTAGLAFEGLNHAGHLKKDLIVILNDNDMSISPNVGALSAYLRRIMIGDLYTKLKKETKSILERIPKVGEPVLRIAQRAEDTVKGLFVPGMLFEELGFEYVGPIDGHNIEALIENLNRFKNFPGPVLIHTITKKGKGYTPAEKSPWIFHGIGPFDIETGNINSGNKLSYSEVFGLHLVNLAKKDNRIVAITAAMTEGTGLAEFARTFPKRFYDVGIAEPHAATFAAGLASQGLRPVIAIYSTFLQRSYDEIAHDVCLQNLPVIFAIDRAGIVGDDGPTHNGAFDLSYLRHIPNIVVMAPKDENELGSMLKTAIAHDGPSAIRYPRGTVLNAPGDVEPEKLQIGQAEVLRNGSSILIVAVGSSVMPSLDAARLLEEAGIDACVINARFIKPLDIGLIGSLAKEIKCVLTVEENSIIGGFGSAVLEHLSELGIHGLSIKRLGIPDKFIEHGHQSLLRKKLGLDAEGIAREALQLAGNSSTGLPTGRQAHHRE
ncbi:MAG TPA: 1-deoxy-D-xylulose-5-phosphate synthase [Nitrospirae bacterium]|nr:1-deoxy-D-xylulose-5-phosphate synthase [bacterium BMS3Abin10]GBE39691.1 1-deoxy-D-xylulose-5-phosphate synthase [bacterium BMS3Bbin08]HDH50937.1 1-deoxy-D-xylulose-5-phosphate synthase [Nitrospirota bacterium]HDK81859.1 1-deoxy-D-xylulose-5-phosphate synthase [Nitrospirota bacterium]